MTSRLVTIINAVAAECNSGTAGWSTALNAVTSFDPLADLKTLATLATTVKPAPVRSEVIGRGPQIQSDDRVTVTIAKRLTGTTADARKAEAVALLGLVEEIENHFLGKTLPGATAYLGMEADERPPYVDDELYDKAAFIADISLTFRSYR